MLDYQSQMSVVGGLTPGLDANGRIPNIAHTRKILSKAASHTVSKLESGAVFIATAAATFTLPAIADGEGCEWTFINAADSNMAVTAPSGKLVADGNAAATTATWSTASHKIGGSCKIIGDGTKYYLLDTSVLLAAPTIS